MAESALTVLQEQYPPARYNLLLPTTEISEGMQWHKMAISIITISPDPRKGDIYPVASRVKLGPDGEAVKDGKKTVYEDLYSLARPAKDRIGTAAGITYDTGETKMLSASSHYVLHQTVGGIRRPDGSWVAFKATKEIDLQAVEMELREGATKRLALGMYGDEATRAAQLYRGKWGPDPKYPNSQRFYLDPADMARAIDDAVRPQMIQWRKNKFMRAETGSRLRVITHLLAIPTQFTQAELTLPFVIPRIDFVPPMDDPDVKRAIIAKATDSYAGLYGGRGGSTPFTIPTKDVRDLGGDDAIDAEFVVKDAGPMETGPEDSGPAQPDAVKGGAARGEPEPPPTSDDATTTISEPEPELPPDICKGCGKADLPVVVQTYSRQHYGKELCRECQKGAQRIG